MAAIFGRRDGESPSPADVHKYTKVYHTQGLCDSRMSLVGLYRTVDQCQLLSVLVIVTVGFLPHVSCDDVQIDGHQVEDSRVNAVSQWEYTLGGRDLCTAFCCSLWCTLD